MKRTLNREEAQKDLVYDSYYQKGHFGTKIFQTIVALLGWAAVFLPFFWLAIPYLFPDMAKREHFIVYKEEIQTFDFLFLFLAIIFLFLVVAYISLTLWNNHRFKTLLQKDIQYDEEQLDVRRALLNDAYDKQFGPEEFRKEVRYYSVKEEQNLDTDFVRNLYKEGGVKL
ncbi:cell division protein [Enterococcus hermanniensis]|uniref:Cell division protein n=1 Tax=Enterococcus hermanniensis TaxID=249189 RepID=A0A1L8TMA0_9ENTE|nr:cell division protein [Enterococcus hermanniensis]OJG45410.1 hypothetical protein RV04_GL002126 [Enterococcus hermanniensis]